VRAHSERGDPARVRIFDYVIALLEPLARRSRPRSVNPPASQRPTPARGDPITVSRPRARRSTRLPRARAIPLPA
jgi:hypothetical protein